MKKKNKAGKYFFQTVRVRLIKDGPPKPSVFAKTPQQIYRLIKPYTQGLDRECLWTVHLNARNQVIGIEQIAVGTVDACLVHPREIFKGAILNNASAIILAHNHISGDLTPSEEDTKLTEELKKAGTLLGIQVIDHVIVSDKKICSCIKF